jgi:hypothetical protein
LLTVSLRVEGNLGKADWVLGGVNMRFVIEMLVPDLLHIGPVVNDTVHEPVLKDA